MSNTKIEDLFFPINIGDVVSSINTTITTPDYKVISHKNNFLGIKNKYTLIIK